MYPFKLRNADHKFKHAVSGYLRQESHNNALNIPLMIEYLCLRYYLIREAFHYQKSETIASNKMSHPMIIMGNGNVIDCYDECIINYKWKLQIKTLFPFIRDQFKIGITAATNCSSFAAAMDIFCDQCYKYEEQIIHSNKPKKCDIIQLIFNAKTKEIGFGINDDKIMHFTQNNIRWRGNEPFCKYGYKYTLMLLIPPKTTVECVEFCVEQNKSNMC